ncbi:hypothetical protein A676_02098 [Salmonella enterica subsp. enterica serovar Enteritidis str. 2010K-0262]|uniref:Uncharacterized protein n=2 Tax=Salmonella enterica I TaxID=59201 RepID=M7SCW5_SALDU|nr:hypothetical protein A670_02064 [Salmonella enterica subsp. enterica serovar Dublin str. UC16]EPI65882.1 hypothetical protein A673_03821 [Salmonella enterica subsp. enterica serovar Enteritidis str. 2009K0958]EPI71199.1 hypothetical protein A672_02764 [Salmonella enterica subsp. enterica serovar Enteritidis str. 08-1080]EPI76127.1 hypothetical protein A671_00192 [Salmonella enterica subsp. enterica serovar Dublin str. DG22]EPI83125.1 hypothetical protein A676_02098 [Salmonella enterica subsp
MAFRIGMHTDMALIEVRHHGFRQRAGMFGLVDKFRVDWLFAHQNRDAGALGFIILSGDVQDVRADNGAGLRQDLGQSVGVIEFIDIGDIAIALFCGFGVADIVNTKTQAFRQIVKAMQFQLFQFLSPP